MNAANFAFCSELVNGSYVTQGLEARKVLENEFQLLLRTRKLPAQGWSERRIEFILQELASMDSNNYHGNAGVGEREGRIVCPLVARRHFYLGHGIGRSGDISEVQPKAAGSSLMLQLATGLTLDAVRLLGCLKTQDCLLVPMATGMALVLCLLALRHKRPNAKYVLWSRIDQKSCFKSIHSAGFIPVVIELQRHGDELVTDVDSILSRVLELGADNILCIVTTTSCFAPRTPDNVPEVAQLCSQHSIPHLVNNAYGLQSSKCMHLLSEGHRLGRVDAFVQSMDKNFMVPVGGAIIASFGSGLVGEVSRTYPGRASVAPITDLFITLLHLGAGGIKRIVAERKERFAELKKGLSTVADSFGERVLETRKNDISMAMTLDKVESQLRGSDGGVTKIGSMLFTRLVSGARVVPQNMTKEINGHTFKGFCSHCDHYGMSFLTAAAAVGMTQLDQTLFIKRLEKVLSKVLQPDHLVSSQLRIPESDVIEETLDETPDKSSNHI